jgi:hypothetical protein
MTANNDSISGRDPEDIMKKILSKLVGIKKSMIGKYQEIKQKSQYDNTIRILDELIGMEERDIGIIENAETSPHIRYSLVSGKESDYEIVDHIIGESDHMEEDDPRSILAWSINKTDEIYKIAQLLSEDYEDPDLKLLLKNIAENEIKRKNRLSKFYDDIVNMDYW